MVRFSRGIPCNVVQPAVAVLVAVTDCGYGFDGEAIVEGYDVACDCDLLGSGIEGYGEIARAAQVEGNVVAGLIAVDQLPFLTTFSCTSESADSTV